MMIPLDRVRRELRRLGKIETHELANALANLAGELLYLRRDEEGDAIHEAVTKLRGIAARKVAEARRSA